MLICELCMIIFKGRIKGRMKNVSCFPESFVEPRKLSFYIEMFGCFLVFFNITFSCNSFDRYTNSTVMYVSANQ